MTKKLIASLMFAVAAYSRAQIVDFAYHLTAIANPLDGGVASSGSSVGPYSGTPVAGDIIWFDGTNWVSLNKPADGTYSLKFTSGIPSYAAAPVSYTRSFTLENPGSAENITMFYFKNASTITEVRCVVKGSATPSVTANQAFGTDRSAAGTNVTTSPAACTNQTAGATSTLDNTAISAGSYMWLTTSAQSGTVTDVNISVTVTEP